MKIKNIEHVKDFLAAVEKCQGEVWLESPMGDKYNLKSELSQYLAICALLKEHGNWLELFCSQKEDEIHFFHFFAEHPEVV